MADLWTWALALVVLAGVGWAVWRLKWLVVGLVLVLAGLWWASGHISPFVLSDPPQTEQEGGGP